MSRIQPITTCPRCDYSLRGSPPEGRCPECGLAYAPECIVWEASSGKSWIWFWLMLGALLVIGTPLTLHITRFLGGGTLELSRLLVNGLVTLIVIGLLLLWVAYRHRRRCVAILGDGILARDPFAISHIRWADLRKIKVGRWMVELHVNRGRVVYAIDVFSGKEHVDFRREVDKRLRTWHEHQAPTSSVPTRRT